MQGLLVLICGGLLSVVLVAMLYGDRFSLVGLFDGRWMSPITQLISNAWVELLLGVDRTVSFVAEHLAWVIAAVSGTVGLSLIAFLMFTGLAEDAAALNRDAATALNAGGVLDQIPDLGDPHIPGATPQLVSLLGHEHRLLQSELGGRGTFAPALPRIEDQIATPGGTESDNWPFENFPGPVRVAEPILSLDLRRLSAATLPPLDEEASVLSRVTNDIPDPRMIDIAVRRLGADDWTRGLGNVNWRGRVLTDRDAIRESTPYEVIDLERGVRIIPGDDVNEQDLRIEKVVPRESAGSQLTVSIHISNEGRDSIRGLLVREYLPIGTTVVDALPGGTYRDDILTWLIDELRPFEEVTLQFTVLADGQTRFRGPVTFGSQTE
ncbi:MAG: DUF11 domain-containing protein, partial [Planctomycetaceae bacterium]|nr:DUF11 domain-containing protein [Planctomycetaceae bacterium]